MKCSPTSARPDEFPEARFPGACNVDTNTNGLLFESFPKWEARLWPFTGDWSFTGAL